MHHLGFLSFSSTALSFGGSKLFQIIFPLGVYIFFQEVIFRRFRGQIAVLFRKLDPHSPMGKYEYLINLSLGFTSWKIGCDLGFLIIATGVAPWQRAFTWSGLVVYTIVQYAVYYLIGTKMLMQGQLNPFKEEFVPNRFVGRPGLLRQIFTKYFHENMNATSYNVPLRQVILKPFVDYGALVLSWSLYNVGLLFFQSGEINFAPLIHFTFLPILAFYLVNVFGFILGFNIGEFAYLRIIELIEVVEAWIRSLALGENNLLESLISSLRQLQWQLSVSTRSISPFLQRYGINMRWLIASTTGLLFVIWMEPSFAGTVFSISDQVQDWMFQTFSAFDFERVNQATTGYASETLLPSQDLLDRFPASWGQLYFVQGDE